MKMKKFISVLMTIAMVLGMCTMVYATGIGAADIKPEGGTKLKGVGNRVLGYVQWFGYAVAVGMLLYIGIKYMMASANEKADLKKGSISYVIGAVIVVAASSLFGLLASVGQEVVGSAT